MLEQSTITRFWAKLDTSGACWVGTGYCLPSGYGQLTQKRFTKLRAHRVAYELEFGPIPDGFHVCHTCDNPPCCNPAHLFLGTDLDNLRDMQRKGRRHLTVAACNGHAKLTEIQVREIRTAAARGIHHLSLAAAYGVSRTAIRDVANGRRWKSLA